MTRSERHEIEHECAKLINRFYHLFNVELSSVVDLFTEDGILDFGGWKLGPGPEAMRQPLYDGGKNTREGVEIVLNTVSNIVIDVIDENTATGVSYDTFWEHGYYDGNLMGRPAPVSAPIGLNVWNDEFRCVDDEWKFSKRRMDQVFNNKRWRLTRK